jgi:hypothetical protein
MRSSHFKIQVKKLTITDLKEEEKWKDGVTGGSKFLNFGTDPGSPFHSVTKKDTRGSLTACYKHDVCSLNYTIQTKLLYWIPPSLSLKVHQLVPFLRYIQDTIILMLQNRGEHSSKHFLPLLLPQLHFPSLSTSPMTAHIQIQIHTQIPNSIKTLIPKNLVY